MARAYKRVRAPTRQAPGARAKLARAKKTAPPSEGPGQQLLRLQHIVGNRILARLVARSGGAVQRVAIDASKTETLYNKETAATGQATASQYTISGTYDLTRQEDTGATVKVKVRFLSQSRQTTPPVPPATTPAVGDLVGEQTVIPEGDTRRDWVTSTMRAAVTNWNGRLAFVGEEAPETDAAGAATPKRLPVTFQAEPVWTKDGDANATVIVHPSSVVGGSTGNPIDAGNFYEQRDKSKYPADDSVIYAHEYGHLLGIPDEYSQNNQQMHLLLHQASPNAAANAAGGALDRVTVERMVLASMARPLYAQLRAAAPAVVSAFRGAQPAVTAKLSEALRQGVRDDAVTSALRTRLEQVSVERLHASVPAIAAFETTANFSARQRALDAIGAVLSGPALTTRVTDGYWQALLTPLGETVNVAGIGDVAINMSSGVYGLGQGTGPAAAPGGRLAATTVGPAATGRRLPPVAPPASLVGQLRAVPATWTAAGSAMQSAITPEAVASRMSVRLNAANIAALVEPLIPGLIRLPKVQQSRALYQKALQLVTNLSSTVSGEILGELLDTQLTPILQASVTALQGSVHAEVERIMNTPAGALAAAAPPDADLVAVVASMKARLDAAKAATAASTSRDPIGAGQAAPDQDVTYSYQGLMGSNRTTALRVDQFQPMLTQFNTRFKKAREKDFRAETR